MASTATAHHLLAFDEKRRFKRKAIELLGGVGVLRTEDLLVRAIQLQRLTVAEADACKAVLEQHCDTIPFASFAQRL